MTYSIPTRRELVKEAARDRTTAQVKETQQEQQEYSWTTCPLSHRALTQPVVSDCAGRLYNKDTILEYLLPADDGAAESSKSDQDQVLQGQVKSLRDVVEVKFKVDKDEVDQKMGRADQRREQWICPVTEKALGPGVRVVYLVPCGHAFSEAGLKGIPGDICVQVSAYCSFLPLEDRWLTETFCSATRLTPQITSSRFCQLNRKN